MPTPRFIHTSLLGILCALVAAIAFSGKAILVKLAYQHGVDAVTLLALRMAFALPFFVGIAWWVGRKQPVPLTRRDWLEIVGLGLMGYYLSSVLDFFGLQYISASLERLILFLYPTMTVLLSALIYQRAIGRQTWAAMALCYAGITLVFVHDMDAQARNLTLGALLVFGSTLSYSVYLLGAAHVIARLGSLRFTALATGVACGVMLLQFVSLRPLSALNLSGQVYALGIALAIFSTVLPVFLLSFAIQRIGAGRAALLGSIGPVSTIFMAYLFLGETISWVQMVGSSLVLAGVLTISLHRKA